MKLANLLCVVWLERPPSIRSALDKRLLRSSNLTKVLAGRVVVLRGKSVRCECAWKMGVGRYSDEDYDKNFNETKWSLRGEFKGLAPLMDANEANHLDSQIKEAKDSAELSRLQHKIMLLKEKEPFLRKIKDILDADTLGNDSLKNKLERLYQKILASHSISDEWMKQIISIQKESVKPPVRKDRPSNDVKLSEVDSITHDATIGDEDTYKGIINFLQDKKYKGYDVWKIKEKTTNNVLFDKNRPSDTVDINKMRHHPIVCILKLRK